MWSFSPTFFRTLSSPWSSSPQPWFFQLSIGSSSPKPIEHTERTGSHLLPPSSSQPSKDQPPADTPRRSPGAAADIRKKKIILILKGSCYFIADVSALSKSRLFSPAGWCCGWLCRWWSRCMRGWWTSLSACLRTAWSPGFHRGDCAPYPGRLDSTPLALPRLWK